MKFIQKYCFNCSVQNNNSCSTWNSEYHYFYASFTNFS